MIVLSSSGLAACGGGPDRTSAITALRTDTGVETTTEPTQTTTTTATATTDTTPTVTATPTTSTPATVTGANGTTTTEIGPGAGDEEAIRVPADFTVSAQGVTPSTITVPAFLTVAVKVTSKDGRAHTLRIAGPKGPITINVPPGGSGSQTVDGLPEGRYPIAIDGAATDGALVVGGEPGP